MNRILCVFFGLLFAALLSFVFGGCLMGYRDLIYNPQILTEGISKEQVIKKAVNYALNPKQIESDIKNLQANFKKLLQL